MSFARVSRALLIGGCGMILLLVAWIGCPFMGPSPSDASLTRKFREHRQDFDALAKLALADTAFVGAGHDPWLRRFTVYVRDTPHSNRRLTDDEARASGRGQYRRLLDRAGVPAISRGHDGISVRFVVSSKGEARKGILYSELPLEPVGESLDGVSGPIVSRWHGYVVLAPRWYLFHEPRD